MDITAILFDVVCFAVLFFGGAVAGYYIGDTIKAKQSLREWQEFNERIEKESKIPSYLTPTPKLKNVERLMREYRDTHVIVNGVEIKGRIEKDKFPERWGYG